MSILLYIISNSILRANSRKRDPQIPPTPTNRQIAKPGILRLLDDLAGENCRATVCVSAETLAERDFAHLLPSADPERARASDILDAAANARQPSDTGIALFLTPERTVAIRPPFPLEVDVTASGFAPEPLTAIYDSRPLVGVVLLRMGRYAVGVIRGDKLVSTKTDHRYVKRRHRAGGSSQRRFMRSRDRLVRELYDKTCRIAREHFEPRIRDLDYVLLGGERNTLNGFVKRCRVMQDLEPKTLSRILAVETPNQRALESIHREIWKSQVTFY